MPSTPTTKSQVQAYQFVLRRMQSALVRKDAVMLHDPMRTHSRATIVGVVLAVIGMLGFIIFGFIKPAPKPPSAGIVIGEQSGQIYVKTENPTKLIPTFNLASARLMLLGQQQQAPADGQQAGQQQPGAAPKLVEPAVVPDEQLKDIPRGRQQGIINAPQLLPNKDQRISDNWAVCDFLRIDPNQPESVGLQQASRETSVLAGVSNLGTDGMGRELGDREALLVTGDNAATYLVYRLANHANQPNASVVKARLAPGNIVKAALGVTVNGRKISTGLLNAIPEVDQLNEQRVQNAGAPTSGFNIDNLPIGAVFKTQLSGGSPQFWVIHQTGIQEISEVAGDIIRTTNTSVPQNKEVRTVNLDQIANVRKVTAGMPEALKVDTYPRLKPEILDPIKSGTPATCLGWRTQGDGATKDERTAVYVSNEVPFPKDANGVRRTPVAVGQATPDGMKIDSFYMQPGRAAVVRAAQSKDSFTSGPISLVSDLGLRYGVPDLPTAQALFGPDPQAPAPENILKLLPAAATTLNVNDAKRTYDSVPVDPNAGSFPSAAPQAEGAGG
ncbi:type VII secretion protein EccB [Amycolatopsis sp. YIM 10]|uniref:type VII secretion protein EccB n=1 Tax=Amycolatopsis sp. YIM 10 TaxID=2653857 RepID=UPI00129048B0|nr:type VII secretion protein EccB [Amycolatopsis sp. YIM 10]QFU93948.1 ESX-1 secretion system protein eccB1 [Amycolatopsis sp. YIM 10]